MNNLELERLTEKTKKLNVMRLMNVYDCLVLCHNIWLYFFSIRIALSRLASPHLTSPSWSQVESSEQVKWQVKHTKLNIFLQSHLVTAAVN